MLRPRLPEGFEIRAATETRERFASRLEIRAVNFEARTIEGYASVFDVLDSYETYFTRESFNATLASPVDGGVSVFIGHESNRLPVGLPVEMRADEYGLWTVTRVAPSSEGDDLLRTAAWLMENGRPL